MLQLHKCRHEMCTRCAANYENWRAKSCPFCRRPVTDRDIDISLGTEFIKWMATSWGLAVERSDKVDVGGH